MDPAEFTILSQLGVATSETLSLYLKALSHVRQANAQADRIPHALLRIYEKLDEYSGGTMARQRLRCVQVLWHDHVG